MRFFLDNCLAIRHARALNEMVKPDPERIVAIVQVVVRGALQALGYGLFALILIALIV